MNDENSQLRHNNNTLQDLKRVVWGLAAFVLFGVISLTIASIALGYIIDPSYALKMSGVALLVAGSCFVFGGFIGFLFGIPKSAAEGLSIKDGRGRLVPNTNLEQVSNWLTTIIIGLGLTQVLTIARNVWVISNGIGESFQTTVINNDESKIISVIFATIIVYYFILGIFFAYYVARTFLPLAFQHTESELHTIMERGGAMTERWHEESARELKEEMSTVSKSAATLKDQIKKERAGGL
jgi:hypothetical protein